MSPIRRQFIEGYSHACDKCLTSIFNLHYVCATCSYEVCPKCFSDKNWKNCLRTIPHSPDHFLLYKKYSKKSNKEIIVRLFKNPRSTEERPIIKESLLAQPALVKATTVSSDAPCVSDGRVDAHPAPPALLKVTIKSSGVLKEPTSPKTVNKVLDVTCAETNRSRPKKIRIVMDQGPTCMTKSYHSLTLKEFQAQWAQRKPVVVTDSLAKSNLEWTPEYFTRNYGKETIEVIDCVSDKAHKTTVKEYFKAFSEPANRKGYARKLGASQILKVKDWPPTENIAMKFPELYNDFMATVPMPEYASAGGYFNLANRLPKECLPPDLGPKMFISYEAGKTNLHCDMADAVNILHYASHVTVQPVEDPPAPAAIWHVFPSERLVELSDWLWKKHKAFLKKWHPIHSQSLFLEEEQLVALAADTGIRPWVIHQNPGDAVFIPAGCPHQVRNCRGAIKCAVDFLSPENLEMSASITNQFSKLPKIDALQLKSTLLFAWKELMDE
ncbi:hypothetical protein G6F22_010169 [Rhizopus arrhizus]|nr:hypothetical protein G6F22_010169 [Rhizopus arrhizus]KAG1405705.1 hypothetical protein G6F58_009969 [Rhizopus delemar]